MADFTWADALKFGSASGLIAGAANQGFGYLRDLAGFRNTAKSQAEERTHQALLRSEAAHAEARPTFLPLMKQVREWISYEWARLYGLEVDYHGAHLLKPDLTGPAAVLRNVDNVATGHPTSAVRADARALQDSLDAVYNRVERHEQGEPGVEDFSAWLQRADGIIDAIHLEARDSPRVSGSATRAIASP